jgi:heme/copper-type cytochrome/quinol oxidase subunit 3
MAIFLATEVMFFGGLVSAFLVLKAGALQWPPPDQPRLPVVVTGLNTLVLLASAWTMQRAAAAVRTDRGPLAWLALSAGLGGLSLVVQGIEWVRLLEYGLTASSSRYGAAFYTLIGAHGLHVLIALVVLGVAMGAAARGRFHAREPERFEPFRMYWLFVCGIWPILYVLVYLA